MRKLRFYKVFMGVISVVLLMGHVSAAQATSIVTSGFNADEIFDLSGSSITKLVDIGYAAWAEQGFMVGSASVNPGLPVSGQFTSATGSGVTYHFAAYTANNALRMGDGNDSSGTLLVTNGNYAQLHILATSGSGGGSSNIILNFQGGFSTTVTNALYAPDWDATKSETTHAALYGLERVRVLNFTFTPNLINDPIYAFYETALTLSTADQGKILESITFNNAASGGATSVYAIDGAPVPLPPSALLLVSGLVGLGLLRRRKRRAP